MLTVWFSQSLANQQTDQKGGVVSFREMRSIHPSPQRHSAQKRFILEKAYQRAEMPWALRIIWSRFILNSECNLLNNESPLLPGLCEVKSASVQPKKGLEMNSGDLWKYRKTHGFVLYGGNPGEAGEFVQRESVHAIYYEEQMKWE